ncbi:hypothetical protein C7M84_012523 [Penaeus vannamei]|uniref:Chitin-binding type-2 domain-containing protein n=1 Tax=Penaeus vannamei TaxID=6689 RepID=A0A3R7PFJ2_PENVA|nr:hypothetical protein C7M84_012523 [Penaeus vannamei]
MATELRQGAALRRGGQRACFLRRVRGLASRVAGAKQLSSDRVAAAAVAGGTTIPACRAAVPVRSETTVRPGLPGGARTGAKRAASGARGSPGAGERESHARASRPMTSSPPLQGGGGAICVLDTKYGWNVECGVRDSYLFRIKDIGGFKANFDFGFGFGDEKGFPQSIKNTNALPHRRSDTVEGGAEEAEAGERADSLPEAPALSLLPPLLPLRRQSDQGPPRPRPQTAPQHFAARPPQGRRPSRPQPPGGGRPGRRPLRTPDGRPIFFRPVPTPPAFAPPAFAPPPTQVIVTHVPSPAPPTPSPSAAPTVGPTMGELLKVNADTPADTDHVPSFAAKTFVVREAPPEFHPPGYEAAVVFPSLAKRVEVPRTKFFCEEQSYLPGIYADVQLGCKVFHLCLPAAMGNTLTSFMCPNMTLFDQSIMQCNYWFNVNCASSPRHYDANLPMALSYRKINAAQLPLTAVRDLGSVALMGLDAPQRGQTRPRRASTSRRTWHSGRRRAR